LAPAFSPWRAFDDQQDVRFAARRRECVDRAIAIP
jgi:hypothetical protein